MKGELLCLFLPSKTFYSNRVWRRALSRVGDVEGAAVTPEGSLVFVRLVHKEGRIKGALPTSAALTAAENGHVTVRDRPSPFPLAEGLLPADDKVDSKDAAAKRTGWRRKGEQRASNFGRSGAFVEWLLLTFGRNVLSSGLVLDVAGGKGDLGMEMAFRGLRSTVIDPRPLNVAHMLRKLTRGKVERMLREARNRAGDGGLGASAARAVQAAKAEYAFSSKEGQGKGEKGGRSERADSEQQKAGMTMIQGSHMAEQASEESLVGAVAQKQGSATVDLLQEAAAVLEVPFPDHCQDWFWYGRGASKELERMERATAAQGQKVALQARQRRIHIEELMRDCSLVVGMHADQATEAIVDFGIAKGIPFAVVPCCVFPNKFAWRRHADGSGRPVRSYDEFLDYLAAKPGVKVATIKGFPGRNKVVFGNCRGKT